MRKSVTLLKSISVIFLCFVLLTSTVSVGFAGQIIDEEEKLQYLFAFNDAVNAIKEENPSFLYTRNAGLNKDKEIEVASKTAADMSEDALKYLEVLIDAFFNPDKGLINNFIGALTDTGTNYTEEEIYKGIDATNLLPVQGKPYVSDLTADDEFSLYAEQREDKTQLLISFPECDLESVEESSLGKVYDLPSGAINPVIIGSSSYDDENDPLDNVKFDNFTYHDASIQADIDTEGRLIKYTQKISYTFSISFYDFLRVLEVYTGTDFIEIGLAIANPILQGTGSPEVTAREVLRDSMIYVCYDVEIVLTGFDWEPRYFGDIDNDGKVDAFDARKALRYSVGIEKIKKQEDLIYADVDFNGVVNSSDARDILRSAVGLEALFCEVPEGEEIKIVVITPPAPETPEEDNNENPDVNNPGDGEAGEDGGENGDGTGLPTLDDVTTGVSDFINGIFDIINGFKGDEVSNEGINSIIQSIKDIVAAGKGDITDNNGGVVIKPDTTENA